MGVEHVHGVVRTDVDPSLQRARVAGEERIERECRERKVVDQVDAAGDVDLIEVVAVDLDEDVHRAFMARGGQSIDELEGLRQHEAGGAGTLDRVADGVEPYEADPRPLESIEDVDEVAPTEFVLDIDVDLLIGERRPHGPLGSVGEGHAGER